METLTVLLCCTEQIYLRPEIPVDCEERSFLPGSWFQKSPPACWKSLKKVNSDSTLIACIIFCVMQPFSACSNMYKFTAYCTSLIPEIRQNINKRLTPATVCSVTYQTIYQMIPPPRKWKYSAVWGQQKKLELLLHQAANIPRDPILF